MKNLFTILLFVFISLLSFSQTDIAYDYDANGNRIVRRIINMTDKSLESTDTTEYNEEVLEQKLAFEEQLGDTQLSYFPNPVKDWLQIKLTGSEKWKIGNYSLFNNDGKLLDQGQLNANNKLDFKPYAPGLYLLKIEVEGEQQVWKILKD